MFGCSRMTSTYAAPTNILILGAGELGTAIARAFTAYRDTSSNSLALTVLRSGSPRADETSRILAALRIASIHRDVATEPTASLAALFSEFDAVISCLGFAAGASLQLKLAEAAVQSTVRCFVPWQWGIDYDAVGRGCAMPLFDVQLDVRDLLRERMGVDGGCGTGEAARRWVIVSTGIFTSFIVLEAYGVVVPATEPATAKKVRALGSWETRVAATRVEDIGAAAVIAVCTRPETKGIVKVAGQSISYGELAEVVECVTCLPVEREVWSVEHLKEELARDPDNVMKRYRVVFAEGNGVAWSAEETWNAKVGLKMMDVEDWLRQNWV